jgi:hypothetical protein
VLLGSIGTLDHYGAGTGDAEGDERRCTVSAETRLAEFRAVMDLLQVDDWEVSFTDDAIHMALDTVPRKELVRLIERDARLAIEKVRPTMILIPATSYNQDHEALHRACMTATRPGDLGRQRPGLHDPPGGVLMTSVSVVSTGSRQVLQDTRIAESFDWRSAHLRFLEKNYGATPYFTEVFPLLDDVYARRHTRLVDHNLDLFEALCGYLAADVRIVRASDVPHSGTREERLRDLVQNVGGDVHLTSTSTTHRIDWSLFDLAGIPVFEQVFGHPVYPQPGGPFVPNLAAADLLFACGRGAGEILRGCNRFELLGPGLHDATAVTGRWE